MSAENPRPYNKQVFDELHTEQGVLRRGIPLSHKYFVCGFDSYEDAIFTVHGAETPEEASNLIASIKETSTIEATWGVFDSDGFQVDLHSPKV